MIAGYSASVQKILLSTQNQSEELDFFSL